MKLQWRKNSGYSGVVAQVVARVCVRLWKAMTSNYFNTDQVLETVLLDGSDLEDEESVEEDFGDLES